MRTLQIVIFAAGAVAFLGAAACISTNLGDTLWRAGVAFLLLDIVAIQLWPKRPTR